jgi:AcrR family transcriptional regulator
MKARILGSACKLFGQYGYHGTTTRMISKAVGIDISTLYYHWGEKKDLYEMVLADIFEDLKSQLARVEKKIHNRPLSKRLAIAIEEMTGYLFSRPEISNLVLLQYFARTREPNKIGTYIPLFVTDIGRSLELTRTRPLSAKSSMLVLALSLSIMNFVAGEDFFRPLLSLTRPAYVRQVKAVVKSIMIPAFAKG